MSTPDIPKICQNAATAFSTFRHTPHEERAELLERLAEALEAARTELVTLAMYESRLPEPRLQGELGRTTGQIRMFAQDLREGRWSAIEEIAALPDRQPLPRPALRRRWLPVGPVAVFGASNFPFAFGSLGGDTASALAAGCSVVIKANPAHERLAARLQELAGTVLPDGVLQTVFGSNEVGAALVQDPHIAAVGFTGSQAGGRALMDLAAARPEPIPVFAEMGSVNPVFLLPGALQERCEALAQGYVASLTMGVGQFCTNPGVVIGLDSPEWEQFGERVTELLRSVSAGAMLTDGIAQRYWSQVQAFPGEPLLRPETPGAPALFSAPLGAVAEKPGLLEECFGPSGVLLSASDGEEMLAFARSMPGQLTATLHAEETDRAEAVLLATELEMRVGRLVWNGWPTGVEVCGPMHHGGPYPASSNGAFTSVGNHAIERWLRPFCEQNWPWDAGV